jgi:hypothetical protein
MTAQLSASKDHEDAIIIEEIDKIAAAELTLLPGEKLQPCY